LPRSEEARSRAFTADGPQALVTFTMEVLPVVGAADDEVRECIRRLVAVIRRSSTGGSPAENGAHVEHIKKVIRVLSLSEEQVSSMREEEQAQVRRIRSNALQKFRLANTVRTSNSSDGTSASNSPGSSPTPGASPLDFSPPAYSSCGSAFGPGPLLSSSAPTTAPLQMPLSSLRVSSAATPIITPGAESMPPPAFYTRKSL
jgi:hypothetical protein